MDIDNDINVLLGSFKCIIRTLKMSA